MIYMYGMKYRGFSPGCQPMNGLVDWKEDYLGVYKNILYYSRKLTKKEISDYELEFIEVFVK